MGTPTEGLSYVARVPASEAAALAAIRHWEGVEVAEQDEWVWLRGINEQRAQAAALRLISGIKLCEERDKYWIPIGKSIPLSPVLSLTWQAISSFLPISLPNSQPSFPQTFTPISLRLIPTEQEKAPFALLCEIKLLREYVKAAPEIRLRSLSCCLMGADDCLIMGTPLLPVPADSYWKIGEMLIPTGYELEFPALASTISQTLNSEGEYWLWWKNPDEVCKLEKALFVPLSRNV